LPGANDGLATQHDPLPDVRVVGAHFTQPIADDAEYACGCSVKHQGEAVNCTPWFAR